VALFDSSMHEKVAEKLALEADLRHAIGEGQLSVHFQPIYELEPYKLSGFEALARWVHPQRGPSARPCSSRWPRNRATSRR
jgi:predicted signal transduction protein with EAL and GGDEF domain